MFVGKPKDRLALRAQHNNGRRKSCEGKAETLSILLWGKVCINGLEQRRYFEYLREQKRIDNQTHHCESIDSYSSS